MPIFAYIKKNILIYKGIVEYKLKSNQKYPFYKRNQAFTLFYNLIKLNEITSRK
jgi:hypothetical protein